jgi:hypothetical protein
MKIKITSEFEINSNDAEEIKTIVRKILYDAYQYQTVETFVGATDEDNIENLEFNERISKLINDNNVIEIF